MLKRINLILFVVLLANFVFAQDYNNKSQYVQRLDSVVNTRSLKNVYKYDSFNRTISFIRYSYYNQNGYYDVAVKKEYIYDNDNNLPNIEIRLVANYPYSTWDVTEKKFYYYDSNGNDTLIIEQKMENNVWKNSYKYTKTYYPSGHPHKMITQNWNNGSWVGNYEKIWSYNSNDGLLSIVNPDEKYLFTRDYYNKVSSFIYKLNYGSYWENIIKDVYTYNSDSNMVTDLEYDYYSYYWELNKKYEFYYDTLIKVKSIVLPITYFLENDGLFNINFQENKPLKGLMYKWWNNSWDLLDDSIAYYYTTLPIGISEIKLEENIKLYPNPATDEITIIGLNYSFESKYSIFDIEGKLIKSGFVSNKTELSINLDGIASGIYIFTLEKEEQSISKKFIILNK